MSTRRFAWKIADFKLVRQIRGLCHISEAGFFETDQSESGQVWATEFSEDSMFADPFADTAFAG